MTALGSASVFGTPPATGRSSWGTVCGPLYSVGPHPAMSSEQRAACFDADPELFFAPDGAEGRGWTGHLAKRLCRRCPVGAACLAWALRAGPYLHGVYGGTNANERDTIRARRRREAVS